MRTPHRAGLPLAFAALVLTACSTSTSGVSQGTSGTGASTTAPDTAASTTAPTTAAVTTPAPTTPATTAGVPPTSIAGGGCAGASGIPAGANVGATIHGDVDGDLQPDAITEYSLNGVPHVHSTLATGGQSDAEVPIGFGDHVSISFEDFDYSLGAATKPPVAVLAIGATKAGTAQFTFLTNTIHYCIQPWHLANGTMFVGRISQEGPFEGLSCDTAAGRRYYALNEAVPDGAGHLQVTQTVFHHNFTKVNFDAPLPVQVVADTPANEHLYDDFANCDHAPLFP